MIDPADWKPADGLILEPNALNAATERERCLALTAGPGAGKTEMLAQRADFLLRTGTCRYPYRILAISFKVDASRNLKDRVRRRCGPELAARFDSYTFHAFAKRIIDRFRPVLTGLDALDPDYTIGTHKVTRRQIEFGDLIPLAIDILNTSRVARNAVRKSYTDVFLDEFQDCTDRQYELVRLAFQGTSVRLTAVGDTKQRIMAWAGALEGVFLTFAADFNAVPLNLYLNFRSQPQLLRMQNAIIRVMDPTSVMPDENIVGDDGEIYAWRFNTSQDEAVYLADQIVRWIRDEGVPHSEIAILVSKQLDLYADLLMKELDQRGIPYRNEQQLQDISVEPVARLIADYLLCLYGTREPGAWLRLMDQLIPFEDEYYQGDLRHDWQRFIKAQRKEAEILDLIVDRWPGAWTFVEKFLEKVGTSDLTALHPDYESASRLEEVIHNTRSRIDELLMIDPDLLHALARFSEDHAVRILTIHKSKGLEFDTVVIVGVEKEAFWGNEAEERCAFFVGVSRAKRRLLLTHADQRARPPDWTKRWDTVRHPQTEYFGYATPFLSGGT
ncbi:UvrD-helicase domain-containing protein [Sedimenticola selenatireducens]|uniref:UvrD-helicase domain-containing protein n=1 Tax=Sedimenticola selenatireducens TaxID=191960 RepID=UPI00048CD9AF|nr:ATP-dependent helicase [Sedimenticola selenatireducens]